MLQEERKALTLISPLRGTWAALKAVLGAGIRGKQEAQGTQGSFLALEKGEAKEASGERAVTPGHNRSLTEACTLHPKA